MEWLSAGTYVRLRSRLLGTFLHADDNGVSVSMSADRASLNTAWRVEPVHQRYLRGPGNYFSLQGAAYGRYLATSPRTRGRGRGHGYFLLQNIFYGEEDHGDAVWLALNVWGAASDEVLIRHSRYSEWHIGVTSENPNVRSIRTQWIVEIIPCRVQPPLLQDPVPDDFRSQHSTRPILYGRAENGGMIEPTSWRTTVFKGRSVLKLRAKLALLLGEANPSNVLLYAWTGHSSPRIPLVVDLPSNTDVMVLGVLNTESPAASALRHPDVDAQ